MATQYASQRQVFGQAVGAHQGIQWMVADMAACIEAARCLVYSTALRYDAGDKEAAVHASMAKMHATDLCMRIVVDCLQITGGNGYAFDESYLVLGLGVNYAAYEAENYRAGIQAIPKGHHDAAIAHVDQRVGRPEIDADIAGKQAEEAIEHRAGRSFVSREPIDMALAHRQHAAYCALLAELGAEIIMLDNLHDAEAREAVGRIKGRARIEI